MLMAASTIQICASHALTGIERTNRGDIGAERRDGVQPVARRGYRTWRSAKEARCQEVPGQAGWFADVGC
jgi:hypothetical protein